MSVTVADLLVRLRGDHSGAMSSLGIIGTGLAAVGVAAVAAGATLVKMGMDAQTELSIVAGLTGSTAAQMSYYTTQLESMGARFGMTLDESAKGLYYVVSAGYAGKDAIDVLTASMLHAAATGVPLKDVANGLTSAMNAYGAKANEAAKYSDILTTAITYGKQTTADFANNVSKAALMAAAAHVPFTQLAAAEAALTEKGEPANRAFTELSFMMSKIAVPSADAMAKSVAALGGHLDATQYQSADLMGKLLLLRNATGLTTDEFLKVVGGTRSARGALGLLADGGVAYNRILDAMRNNTGVTEDAFNIHTKNMAFAFDRVKAAVSNAGYELVKMISPAVVSFLGHVADAVSKLPDMFKKIGDIVSPVFKGMADSVSHVEGPMRGFGKAAHDASDILVQHKGIISQVADILRGLFFDSVDKVKTPVEVFRGGIERTSWVLKTHKGLISEVGDFIKTQLVPAFLKAADFVKTQLVPAFQRFADFMQNNVIPTARQLWEWFQVHIVPILKTLGEVIVTKVIPALQDIWKHIQGDLIPAFERLWAKIEPKLTPALKMLGDIMRNYVGPAVSGLVWLLSRLFDLIGWLIDRANDFQNGLNQTAYHMGQLKDKVGDALGKLGEFRDFINSIYTRLGDLIVQVWKFIDSLKNIHLPNLGGFHVPGFAEGGVTAGGAAIVGENGPELALFPQGTRIIPASQTAALMSGGGGGSSGGSGGGGGYKTANITIMLDGRTLAQGLAQPLVDQIRIATGLRV